MKRTRIINLIAIFVNLAIFAAFFAGFYFKFLEPCIKDFNQFAKIPKRLLSECRYYEFIAAVITMLASLFMMFANGKSIRRMRDSTPRWIYTLRYISMGMSILIIATNLLAIVGGRGMIEDPIKTYLNFKGYQFYWCIVMPFLSVLCFVLLELEPKCKFRKNFGPFIMWVIYCAGILGFMFIYYIPQKGITKAADFAPYFIFLLTKDLIAESSFDVNQVVTISFFVITMVMSFVLPMLLRLLNRVLSSLIIGYEYVEIDDNDNVVRPINRSEKHKDEKKVETKAKPVHYENIYRVYVNDRKLRNWKVVLPNKSIKVFTTQQEALTFAADKARRSKGTVRVHTALGKLKFENQ